MKEREPNFEDDRIRAWVRQPKEENWEGLGQDSTVLSINEETEEIFESRTYRFRPTPEAYLLALDIVQARVGPRMVQMRSVASTAVDPVTQQSSPFSRRRPPVLRLVKRGFRYARICCLCSSRRQYVN